MEQYRHELTPQQEVETTTSISTSQLNTVLSEEFAQMKLKIEQRLFTHKPEKVKMTTKKLKKTYPDYPTKNKSAYIFYCNEARPKLAKENLTFNEIGKRLGVDWKKLSPEQMKKYSELADQDKKRYIQGVKEFNEKHLEHQIKTPNQNTKSKHQIKTP